jgi:hypothetical protein
MMLCIGQINPLMPELNPSAQHCLTRFFTGNFASWTMHFFNKCVKNQQTQQLFIQFIYYVWYFLHVLVLHCHPQWAFLVPSERCSIGEQSKNIVDGHVSSDNVQAPCHYTQHTHPQYSIDCSSIEHLSEALGMLPEDGNVMPKHVGDTIHN